MSDSIWVACITSAVVVATRVMSHFEHRETKQKIDVIAIRLNGGLDEKIESAVKKALE